MAIRGFKRLFMRILIWGAIAIVALAAVFSAFAAWHVFVREREAKYEHDLAAESLDELKTRKTALEERLDDIETERGIEEEIRDRYPLVKEGEAVITIVSQESDESAVVSNKRDFWGTIFGWFGR